MEELYDNLENYNEVNTLEELRNENKDLKLKLEEYETAMGKLQKDYDNLGKEFHVLQINYSSLLKTARAEVERKTKMITQLNNEKDAMMLQTLQSGKRLLNNRLLNNKQNKVKKGLLDQKKIGNTETSNIKANKYGQTQKDSDVRNQERCETSSPSSNISGPSSENTKLLNIIDKVVGKVESCNSKTEFKENNSNYELKHKDAPKIQAGSIEKRRKSMSAFSLPKFSSDEEWEPKNATEHETRKINIIPSKLITDRLSNKTSETSSIEGRSSNYQEPIKEGYRNRISRPYDSDKHGMIDRFRENDRYRESDRYRETDRFRESFRFRESDRYRQSDRFRNINKFRESDKHREFDKFREKDMHRRFDKYMDKDKHDSFQRFRKHSPERPSKRSHQDQDDYHRTEYDRQRAAESPPPGIQGHYHHKSQEDRVHFERKVHDNNKFKSHYEERHVGKYLMPNDYDEPNSKRLKIEAQKRIPEYRDHYDNEPIKRVPQTEACEYDLLRTSCQSPDAAFLADSHTDGTLGHTIKEIKSIAITPLEDPRVTSEKYIMKTENDKTTLTTAQSKNIDIRPVDKSLWNIESVAIPDALLHKPPLQLFNDEHIKDIYMDIDNANANVSLESGEIYNFVAQDSENNRENEINSGMQDIHLVKQIELPSLHTSDIENVQDVPICGISKGKQCEQKTQSKVTNTTEKLPEELSMPKIISEDHIASKNGSAKSLSSLKLQPVSHDLILPSKTINEKPCKNINDQNKVTLSHMMVQDDLELSDETSDNVDFSKHIVKEILPSVSQKNDDTENKHNSRLKNVPKENMGNTEISNIKKDDKLKESDSHKKHKNKRRKTKSKEKELEGNIVCQSTEKKIRTKKEKESKPNIKTKFTDLFGDSSSLITPEDLGMPMTGVPLFEDAQDAVDINIQNIITTPLSSTDTKEINNDENKNETEYNTNIDNINTRNKDIDNRLEERMSNSKADGNIIYQNLNSEVEKDKSEIVKTIIISSGVQPQFVMDNKKGTTEKRIADVEVNIQNIVDCNQVPPVAGMLKQIIALATSTPQKEFSTLQAMEPDVKTVDCITNSNNSKNESLDTTGQSVDPSTDAPDVPDVRIFVKRRRKGVKKT